MLLSLELSARMSNSTAKAPKKAATVTPKVDHNAKVLTDRPVAVPSNTTKATPRLEPLLMPKREGSAKSRDGLWQTVVQNDGAFGGCLSVEQSVPKHLPRNRYGTIAQIQGKQHQTQHDGQEEYHYNVGEMVSCYGGSSHVLKARRGVLIDFAKFGVFDAIVF